MGLVALIVLMTASLSAQVSPADATDAQAIRELLASNDPARMAWGAELAGRYGRQEVVPELLRLLRSRDERVQANALDALIRLKAQVPAEELTPLGPRFTDA